MNHPNREFTQTEKHKVESLVKNLCANYNLDYGCLPLECDCYMLSKYYTSDLL